MENNETPIQELKRLTTRAEMHQKALGLSDNTFSTRYKTYVGSAKTWRSRLLSGNFDGLNIERKLRQMRAFISLIDGGSAVEQVFEDLPIYQEFMGRYERLQSARNDQRVMVFLGETGVGKSVCAKAILRRDPANTAYVRCQPVWKDNYLSILNGILVALGRDEISRKSKAFKAVIDILKSQPITLMFDEAHDGGVALLKLVKSFVDETSCKFVIMAYPTLWKRMLSSSSDAHSEARQLFGRTQKPVFDKYAHGTDLENVRVFLNRSTALNGTSNDVAIEILEIVRSNGNLRLLSAVIDAADALFIDSEETISGPIVIEIAKRLASSKGVKK